MEIIKERKNKEKKNTNSTFFAEERINQAEKEEEKDKPNLSSVNERLESTNYIPKSIHQLLNPIGVGSI